MSAEMMLWLDWSGLISCAAWLIFEIYILIFKVLK